MKGVLGVALPVCISVEALVSFVVGEEQLWTTITEEKIFAKVGMRRCDCRGLARLLSDAWFVLRGFYGPGIAKPEMWKQRERRRLLTAVADVDADQKIFWRRLGILHFDIKVCVVSEDAGVHQFIFQIGSRPAAVGLHEIVIRVCSLRILIQVLHIGMRRSVIDIKVIFFYVFSVIAFGVR